MIRAFQQLGYWLQTHSFRAVEIHFVFRNEVEASMASSMLVHEWERDLSLLPSSPPDPYSLAKEGSRVCGIPIRFVWPAWDKKEGGPFDPPQVRAGGHQSRTGGEGGDEAPRPPKTWPLFGR